MAGLAHIRAELAACPSAVPWRMDAHAYQIALARTPGPDVGLTVTTDETPWDHALAHIMTGRGSPTYEEALFPELLKDLARGHPSSRSPAEPGSCRLTGREVAARLAAAGGRNSSPIDRRRIAAGTIAHRWSAPRRSLPVRRSGIRNGEPEDCGAEGSDGPTAPRGDRETAQVAVEVEDRRPEIVEIDHAYSARGVGEQ